MAKTVALVGAQTRPGFRALGASLQVAVVDARLLRVVLHTRYGLLPGLTVAAQAADRLVRVHQGCTVRPSLPIVGVSYPYSVHGALCGEEFVDVAHLLGHILQ